MVGTGAAGERGWSFGTLLGPEITGPGFSCMPFGCVGGWVLFFLDCPAHGLSRTSPLGGVLVVGVTGLLFGNCIVDASIL